MAIFFDGILAVLGKPIGEIEIYPEIRSEFFSRIHIIGVYARAPQEELVSIGEELAMEYAHAAPTFASSNQQDACLEQKRLLLIT